MNKPFKVFSTASVAAVAATSMAAVAPVSAAAADAEMDEVSFEIDGNIVTENPDQLNYIKNHQDADGYDTYFNNDGNLKYDIQTVQINDETYLLDSINYQKSQNPDGTLGDWVEDANPIDSQIYVDSVSAINAYTVEVTFDNDETTEIDLDEALTDGENEITFTYQGNQFTATVSYDADTEAPELSVDGNKTVEVENGGDFNLPDATGTDNRDENVDVTSVITNAAGDELDEIDTTKAGTYTITYSAEDEAGNKADDVEVTVNVAEAAPPVPPTPAVPVVDSVGANNGTVTVTFNKDVEEVPEDLSVTKDDEALELDADAFKVVDGQVEITVPKVETSTEGVTKVTYGVTQGDATQEATVIVPAELSPATDLVAEATEAVEDFEANVDSAEKVEGLVTDSDERNDVMNSYVPAANTIQKLNSGEEKEELQSRLDAANDVLIAAGSVDSLQDSTEDLNKDNLDVAKATVTKSQNFVDAVEDGDAKDTLQGLIDEAQENIDDFTKANQEEIDEAVNKAQDAIDQLGEDYKDVEITGDNLTEAQDDVSKAKDLIATAKDLDENVVFETYALDQLEDKIADYISDHQDKVDNAVNTAQDAIDNLPETVTSENIDDVRNDVAEAKDFVADAHELDENVVFETYALDQLEEQLDAVDEATNAISDIGDPADFSLEDLDDDAAKVANAEDKVEVVKDSDVKAENVIVNYDHFELAQNKIDELKDQMENAEAASMDARSALTNLPIAENITLDHKGQVEKARTALNKATDFDNVKEADFNNVWKLTDAEDKIETLEEEKEEANKEMISIAKGVTGLVDEDEDLSADVDQAAINDLQARLDATNYDTEEDAQLLQKKLNAAQELLDEKQEANKEMASIAKGVTGLVDEDEDLSADVDQAAINDLQSRLDATNYDTEEDAQLLQKKLNKAQKLVSQQAFEDEVAKFTSDNVTVKQDAEVLTLPELSDGYTATVASSTDEDVITSNGEVIPPENESTVDVEFLVSEQKANGKTATTDSIEVTVPQSSDSMVKVLEIRTNDKNGSSYWSIETEFEELKINELQSLKFTLYNDGDNIGEQEATEKTLNLEKSGVSSPFYIGEDTEDGYWNTTQVVSEGVTPDKVEMEFEDSEGNTRTVESTDTGRDVE
ncbi:hypothetical protein GCM10028778_17930 [Barrientosiimonas marina]|uniref:Immunoglobulin-like domain-containing protein n=1 Tax=Lentibacillus kimchii TaxID=1542911 RepID=A0ABW2US33_9BACI